MTIDRLDAGLSDTANGFLGLLRARTRKIAQDGESFSVTFSDPGAGRSFHGRSEDYYQSEWDDPGSIAF